MSPREAPWLLSGSSSAPPTPADEARRLLYLAERRPPTDADRPVSTFPPTRASREARRFDRLFASPR